MTCIIHAWEQHILGIFVLVFSTYNFVLVLFVFRGFLLALIDRIALLDYRLAIVSVHFQFDLRGISLSVEQRAGSVLFATHVLAQGKEVFRRVLVHWRISSRTDNNDSIARVADNQHEHAEERSVLDAGTDERLARAFVL